MKVVFAILVSLSLSSFIENSPVHETPKTVTRSVVSENGDQIQKTIVTFDKFTSADDIIATCAFLEQEHIKLTFGELTIGRKRIKQLRGTITLPDGQTEDLHAGGVLGFRSVKIHLSTNQNTRLSRLEMIEIID